MPRQLYVVRVGEKKERIVARYGKAVWGSLANHDFINRDRVACVGFAREAHDGSLILVLPKAYALPEDGRHEIKTHDVFQLIRVFRKARRDLTTPIERGLSTEGTGLADRSNDATLDFLDAALYLRDDYRRHGLYRRKHPVPVRNSWSHPVDWRRTLDSSPPYLSRKDILFHETTHRARQANEADLLRRLQATVVCDAFGLSGENVAVSPEAMLTSAEWRAARLFPDTFMRRAQHGTYDDRGRKLCVAIRAYLGVGGVVQSSGLHKDQWFSYTAEFEYIWEAILRSLFCLDGSATRLPAGRWYPFPNTGARKGIAPAIEIRVQTPSAEALVDAKDYGQDLRVINGFTWNGTPGDYYKQVIYRLLLTASERKQTVNILAFPGSISGQLFQVRGCHVWPDIESSQVFEVLVDYDLAVRHWLGEQKRDTATEVRELIAMLRSAEATIMADCNRILVCDEARTDT